MVNARRIAGLKGAAKRAQMMSAANHQDLDLFMRSPYWNTPEAKGFMNRRAMNFQVWRRDNAAKARRLLWKLLEEQKR